MIMSPDCKIKSKDEQLKRLKHAVYQQCDSTMNSCQDKIKEQHKKIKVCSPLTELSFLANGFLKDFIVSLQKSVMLSLELLQLCRAALETLLALCQSRPQLFHLRDQLLPEKHTTRYSYSVIFF